MKLYHFPISPNSRRAVAVLHQLDLACEIQLLDLLAGEQLREDFVALNPNHMVPTLVDGDFVLWEANAIMQYLCSKVPVTSLWPQDLKIRADIARWQFWQSSHFGRACGIFIYENLVKQALKLGDPDAQELAKGAEQFHRYAKVLEDHLQGRDWLVGEGVTLADFSVGSFLDLAGQVGIPLADYGAIQRWYGGLSQLPCWQSSAPSQFA